MRRPSIRSWSTLSLVSVSAAIVGCSALQIDVDVYKGPLASQREVQLRQFSTLAIAAKPLLAELRNDAETRNADFKSGFDANVRGQYLEQYSPYAFQDQLAKFANGALSFYDDLGPRTFLPQSDAIQEEYGRFADAIERFEITQDDCDLSAALELHKPPDTAKKLTDTFVHFLRADSSGTAQPSKACRSTREAVKKVPTGSASFGKRRVEALQKSWSEYCSSNTLLRCESLDGAVSQAYLQLSGGGIASQQAQAIYPNDAVRAQKLAKRIAAIGRAFADARVSMERLNVLSLQLLGDSVVYQGSDASQARQQMEAAASLVSNVVEPRTLACAVERLGFEPPRLPRRPFGLSQTVAA